MRLQTYLVPRVTLSRVHLMLLIDAVEQVAGSEEQGAVEARLEVVAVTLTMKVMVRKMMSSKEAVAVEDVAVEDVVSAADHAMLIVNLVATARRVRRATQAKTWVATIQMREVEVEDVDAVGIAAVVVAMDSVDEEALEVVDAVVQWAVDLEAAVDTVAAAAWMEVKDVDAVVDVDVAVEVKEWAMRPERAVLKPKINEMMKYLISAS